MSKVFKLFSQNKKTLFFVVGLGLILTFFSWQYLEAGPIVKGPDGKEYDLCTGCGAWPHEWPNCLVCFIQYIGSLPIRIIFAAIVGIIGLGALLAGLLYAVTATIVNWLIGIIMTVGVVPGNPLTPGIVEIGWDFSRGFANMFFVVALAFIGLATILRIEEYKAKKALPILIIIALLINFTPVIVGFIVDMGNLVTKFFLNRAGSIDTLGDIMNTALSYLGNSLPKIFLEDGHFFEKFFEIIAKFIYITVYGLALLVFFSLATFIYLLIGAVFFCRTVILWILMILAPIAFLSKIFPDTKITKMVFPDILHWDKWWEKLIQWTIVGIPITFFLYLSNSIMSNRADIETKFAVNTLAEKLGTAATSTYSFSSTNTEFVTELTGLQTGFVDLVVALLAPTIALVLLVMGALISLKAVPEGAKGIMRFTTEKGIQGTTSRISGGVRRMRDAYHATRATRPDLTGRQALGQVIKGGWGERPWKTWPWQKKQPPTPTTSGDSIPRSPGTVAVDVRSEAREGLPGSERLERRQRLARGEEVEPLPSTPPTAPAPSGAARTRRFARGFFIVEPAKIGLWAGKGILKAARDTTMARVEKELKVKTKTCSNCGETNISTNKKFCPECGQSFS